MNCTEHPKRMEMCIFEECSNLIVFLSHLVPWPYIQESHFMPASTAIQFSLSYRDIIKVPQNRCNRRVNVSTASTFSFE